MDNDIARFIEGSCHKDHDVHERFSQGLSGRESSIDCEPWHY